jgi:hypothetical protein
MIISRRTALQAAAVVPLMGSVAGQQRVAMYGLIGRIKAYTGKRDDLGSDSAGEY